GVTVTPGSGSVYAPETDYGRAHATLQLSAAVTDSKNRQLTGRVLTWTTSNASLADVDQSGLVSAKGLGSPTIAASSGNVTGISALTVLAPVASLSFGGITFDSQ